MEGDGSIRLETGLFVPGDEDPAGRNVQRHRTARRSSGKNTSASLNPTGGVSPVVAVVKGAGSVLVGGVGGGERWSGGGGRREEARDDFAGRKVKIGREAVVTSFERSVGARVCWVMTSPWSIPKSGCRSRASAWTRVVC
jgi:hypothetical protein